MLKLACYFIIIFTIMSSYAKVSAVKSEIIINADSVTVDDSKNVAFFTGEVIIWFADMKLKTSEVNIFYQKVAGKNTIDKIIIPVKLTAACEQNQEIIIADRGEYNFKSHKLVLSGNVLLSRQEHILQTKKLVYILKLKGIDYKE